MHSANGQIITRGTVKQSALDGGSGQSNLKPTAPAIDTASTAVYQDSALTGLNNVYVDINTRQCRCTTLLSNSSAREPSIPDNNSKDTSR